MKKTHIILFTFLSILKGIGQPTDIDYFGQTPPGDSAIVFAPDFISTDSRFVQNSSFSPKGNEFCFTVTNGNWDIFNVFYTKYENDQWSDPVKPDFLNSLYASWGLFFSPDTSRYYLVGAETPGVGGSFYYAECENEIWNDPIRIPEPISTSHESEPSVSYENTLYFSRDGNINYSELQNNNYSETTIMEYPINTSSSNEGEAYISPDEDYLIFSSNRSGSYGQYDLYISYKKTDGKWTDPINLGPKINTVEWEFVPSVSPDGKYLLFTRRKGWPTTIPSKILWVSTSFIEELKPTGIHDFNITDNKLNIFPNPANNIINIEHTGNIETASYAIFNLQGNIILHGNLNDNSIDISQFSDGFYFLRIDVDDVVITKKIIKHL